MSNPIENLTIHAFRGLRELELLELGSINLFVGPNNSGKTSVLEAIGTFCRPLDVLEWVGAARRSEVKLSRDHVRESLCWLFPQTHLRTSQELFYGETAVSATGGTFPVSETKAVCEEKLSVAEAESEPMGEADDDLEESGVANSSLGLDVVTELRLTANVPQEKRSEFDADPHTGSISRKFDIWPDSRFTKPNGALVPELPVSTVSSCMHRIERLQVRQLTALTKAEHKTKVVKVLKLFDDQVVDLEILSWGVTPTIYVQHERLGRVPLSTCGDGMRRALVIAMSLILAERGVLLIDEVETAIHTSVLGTMFEWLARACIEFNVQLFATTHSLEAVDAMMLHGGKTDLSEVVTYHLDYSPQKTVARRIRGDLLRRLRLERGLDVR